MRAKQKEFHNPKTRTGSSCQDAIALERQVDRALAELARPPSLFDVFDRPEPQHDRMIAEIDDVA